jgi:NitT/TauT family transport system ATP-binding protein
MGVEAISGSSSITQGRAGDKTLVHVQNASLRYGSADTSPAVHELEVTISEGEFAAVVGPSGCGKSTLMKLISGLAPPTEGRVVVDGREVREPLKNVGMAFQNPALLPWRTTLDNVLLPLQVVRPHRSTFARERAKHVEAARQLLESVGLVRIEGRFPWELSGGMQQRVSLCRALIHKPKILLLDEPFGALDAFTREELWDVLQRLWRTQKFTVLLVTHDLVEAVYLADTVHVISSRPGRVIYSCAVDIARPRNSETRFTPQFVETVHVVRSHIGRAMAAL